MLLCDINMKGKCKMKNKYVVKAIALILTLALCMPSFSISALAQETSGNEVEPDEDVTVAVDVMSADELEDALASGEKRICIADSFEIDRTFYVTNSVTIYSENACTLTRAAGFAGDIFVVGEDAEGNFCDDKVILSVGNKDAENSDILTIDGNKENVNVTVNGTVFFVGANSQVDLYSDLTVKNCEKKGNERALDTERYALCNDRTVIGGAVGIIVDDKDELPGGIMNVYGGKYLDNGVVESGKYGGAFFNHNVMYVYDGLFDGNYASRAGAFYNYRTMYIYKAVIQNNTATTIGGAIYLPASSGANLYVIGQEDSEGAQIVFKNNSAEKNAGAIYTSGKLELRNVLFEGNSATESGGAVMGSGKYVNVIVRNCEFKLNSA